MMMQQNIAPLKKAEININENNIDAVCNSIYGTILSNIQKSLRKCSGWIINLVIDHNTNISKYNPIAGGTYIKLPKELDHPKQVRLLLFKILMTVNTLNGV